MDKYIMSRGTGKTTAMIERSAATNSVIVCASSTSAKNIQARAAKMGLSIPRPIPVNELKTLQGNRPTGILIDDADMVLLRLISQECYIPIEAITISPEG